MDRRPPHQPTVLERSFLRRLRAAGRSLTLKEMCGTDIYIQRNGCLQAVQRLLALDVISRDINDRFAEIPGRAAKGPKCSHGHEMTENNVYQHPVTGKKTCKECRREWARMCYWRKKLRSGTVQS